MRRPPVAPFAILPLLALSTLACLGDLTPAVVLEGGAAAGEAAQTADAATQQAVETEIAAGARPAVLDLLEVEITARSCAPHGTMANAHDCAYTGQFLVAFETPATARVQCFFSRSESERLNVDAGAGEVTITIVHQDLVFAPGTEFDGLCQLRDLESDELLFQERQAIAVVAP